MENQGNTLETVQGTANQDTEYEYCEIMTRTFGSIEHDRQWTNAVIRDEKLRNWAKRTWKTIRH
jgi:hypothetical protein